MIDDKIFNEIIAACKKDTRLFSVILDISTKSKEERYVIRKKVSLILSNSNGDEKEALKFYYIITDDNAAEEIIRRIENG